MLYGCQWLVLFPAPANDPFPENKQAASLAHLTDAVGWREGFGRGGIWEFH